MFSDFCTTANAISATTSKSEKEQLLAAYLVTLDDASLERAAVFFTGSPFPRSDQRTIGIGGSAISEALIEVTGQSADEVWAAWSTYGDAGDTAAEHFAASPGAAVTLAEVGETVDLLAAASGAIEKKNYLVALLPKLGREGVRYVVKILLRELRIGVQEGLVETAIAKAFHRPLAAVRRANMLTGNIGVAALLARGDALDSARMRLFQPFAFMLAQPEEDPDEIVAMLGSGAFADDKYDGIRAQIHATPDKVRIFSRTLDDVTHRFPEIETAARALGRTVVLDGEIVAFRERILPFATIQRRLGRRKVSEALLRDTPVVFFAFDVLLDGNEILFELPLRERLIRLRGILPPDPTLHSNEAAGRGSPIRAASQTAVRDGAHLDALFDAARARANEGLVVKAPESIYTPGRRGKSWLKYKKALATLDCVVTAAEYGHGKRRALLSDLTFAVLRDGALVNIGKAYSGLTDTEIEGMTKHFQATTTGRYGPVHTVEPAIVLEIAFDRIQESSRHKSGYALRFPRIARIRDDKTVEQASTIDEVRRIYEGQLKRERQE